MRGQVDRLRGAVAVVVATAMVVLAGMGVAGAQNRDAPGAAEEGDQAPAKPERARRVVAGRGLKRAARRSA